MPHRTYLEMFFDAEILNILSEKLVTRGGIAIATSRSATSFAARRGEFMAERIF